MSNLGRYQDLTTAAHAAGGVGRYLLRVRGTSAAAGLGIGIAATVAIEAARDPDSKPAKVWRCRVRRTHRPIRRITGIDWSADGLASLRGDVTSFEKRCQDCEAPCPA